MASFLLFLGIAVALGVAILVWDWRCLGEPARLDQYERFLDRSPGRFDFLARINAPEDFDFLRRFPGGDRLARRLLSERRYVTRYVLVDLRVEFRAMVAVGIMLAASPTARNESFGLRLM